MIAALATAVLVVTSFRRESPDARAIRFVVAPPEGASFTQSSAFMAVSPDGRSLAFVASSQEGKVSLWIRSLDSLAARDLSINGVQPFWSPDSRFLGVHAGGKLKKIDVTSGVAQTLADSYAQTGAWSRDGAILFKPTRGGGLYRISTAGGRLTPVTTPDPSLGETAHDWPQFLPDGRHFLYLANSTQPEHDSVHLVSRLTSLTAPSEKVAAAVSWLVSPIAVNDALPETLRRVSCNAVGVAGVGDVAPLLHADQMVDAITRK